MRIDRITIEGLRSTDRTVDLAPLTLIRGPVESGKTSVCDAVRLAALGCVPAVGRDSKAIAKLMRNGRLRIAVRTDDGRLAERGYVRQGDRLTGTASASWLPAKSGLTESAEAIRTLFGGDDRETAEHLDLRQLLSCSPNERAKRIEALLDASGISIEEIVARASSMTTMRLAGIEPERMPEDRDEASNAAAGATGLIDKAARAALTGVLQLAVSQLQASGLAYAIGYVNERKRSAVDDLNRRKGARAEIEDRLRAIEAQMGGLKAPSESIEAVEKAREDAANRKAAAARDLEAADQAAAVRAQIEPALPSLKQAVADAQATFTAAKERLPEAARMREQASALVDPPTIDAPEVAVPDAEQLAEAARLLTQSEEITREADAMDIPEPLSIAEQESRYRTAALALQRAEISPWRQVESLCNDIERFCTGITPAIQGYLRSLRILANENGGNQEFLLLERDEADFALQKAHADRDARGAEIAANRALREETRKLASEAKGDADRIRKAADDAAAAENRRRRDLYAEQVGEREGQAAEISDRREALLAEAERITSAALDAQGILDRAESDLRAQMERLAGIESVATDPETAREALAKAERDLPQIETKLHALRGSEALRSEMRALMDQVDEATARRDCWTAVEWSLQRLRGMDMAARSGGLVERMQRYLHAAGRTEEPFLRTGKASCDFGWIRDGNEIAIETMSGNEVSIFGACLLGAILAIRKPPMRILLVEGAETGLGRAPAQLMAACAEMVTSGDIDQALLATCLPVQAEAPWMTVDFGAMETAEVRS